MKEVKVHYLVQINSPAGIRPLACFSDYDTAFAMAKDIDWAQVVIYMEPAA